VSPESFFDFQSVSEEAEELDFKKTVLCPHCKKPIPHEAIRCLYCGEEVVSVKKPAWVVWTAVLLVIIFVVFFVIFM